MCESNTPNKEAAPRAKQTPADFEWGEQLGEGSYSRVLRATLKADGQVFAVKVGYWEILGSPRTQDVFEEFTRLCYLQVVEKALVIRERKEKYVAREKEALLLCRHPMIVRLHSTFQVNLWRSGRVLLLTAAWCPNDIYSSFGTLHRRMGRGCTL